MSVKPITPEKAAKGHVTTIPDVVLKVFNSLLSERYSTGGINIEQDEVVNALVSLGMERNQIFDHRWLDVEPIYRAAGWKVVFDKPGYNESYGAYWTFTRGD